MNGSTGWSIHPLSERTLPGAQSVMRRSIAEDFGDAYDPLIHADVDDPLTHYAPGAGPFLLVVTDDSTDEVLATGGIRSGRLKPGRTPRHVVDRYEDGRHGQLVRVYVRKEARRRGIARALVHAVLDRADQEGHYEAIALHTYQHSPGAVAFWESFGAQLIHDDSNGATGAVFYDLPRSSR
ncbi:GNAT family N-acetyltransferase [Nonomuraea sp. CA-143628]|uniref:GNAT family N-acetyltransferase n=1 Tax=Nonomuraea sp. CA-143628 TaxID=3239997 RepID=UPI003D8CE9D0